MSDVEAEKKGEEEEPKAQKRPHSEAEESDDEWVGPMPSEAAPQKKKRVLEYEKIFLENLPCAESYERSYM